IYSYSGGSGGLISCHSFMLVVISKVCDKPCLSTFLSTTASNRIKENKELMVLVGSNRVIE
ncbi:MAG: hypothetical protein P9X27_01950, partial [Candidatus Kaelpia aquatica]|nr:hypothetical protein [Candidatus Kaelpia aquatica]